MTPNATPPARPAVLITGAARRIGRSIALDLAAQGWDVAVHFNDSASAAHRTVADVCERGARAVAVEGDLADPDAPARIVERAHRGLGRLDCLINNASLFEEDDLVSVTPDSWNAHLAVNLRAPVFLTQAFAARFGGEAGNVVNIIDQRIWRLNPQFFSYTLAKSALWTATRTMAQALAPRIRVNAIGPGPTLPNKRQSEQDFARQESALLLGRGSSPQEICAAIRFILSAPAMTGQMIALDGGQHLAWRTPDVTSATE